MVVWDVSSKACVERYDLQGDGQDGGGGWSRVSALTSASVSLSQAEAREGLHGVLPGLAHVREAAGLHGHGGSPGPAGRTRHLQHHGQRKGRHNLGIQRRKHRGPGSLWPHLHQETYRFQKKSV